MANMEITKRTLIVKALEESFKSLNENLNSRLKEELENGLLYQKMEEQDSKSTENLISEIYKEYVFSSVGDTLRKYRYIVEGVNDLKDSEDDFHNLDKESQYYLQVHVIREDTEEILQNLVEKSIS